MGITAKDVIALATKQIGTVEKVSNDVKYNTWFYGRAVNDAKQGGDVYPWCMAFQSWLFAQLGGLDLIGGKSASCSQTAGWFQRHNKWHTSPKVGDLVFFTFSHVGLVIEVHNGYIVTIEGNTSSNDSGSQRNGGMVAKRTRRSSIKGYGRPAYSTSKKTTETKNTRSTSKKYEVAASVLRVRASASTSASIVGKYSKGKVVEVTKYNLLHTWGKTKDGWICLKYTKKIG